MTELVVIRATDPEADREARAEVVRRSWEGAYREIFTNREIERVFDGSLGLAGDWTGRRTGPAGTLVAELAGRVIGVSSMGLMEARVGELAGFYVLPEHQGRGVGSQLWNATLDALRERGCTRMEVWTLTRGDARRFYEARGCARIGDGVLRLGGHVEQVAGYGLELRPAPAWRAAPGLRIRQEGTRGSAEPGDESGR